MLGRPFLYAYSAYGTDGVDRAIQILKDEMEMNMRLIGKSCFRICAPYLNSPWVSYAGAPNLSDVTADMIDTSNITQHNSGSVE